MTLNMNDDLDMSMRAPYISMSESSELPMLIAEDLMWGAQPDLKHSLNISKKVESNLNNQLENFESQVQITQPQKLMVESSLASLLCSQLLQHQHLQSTTASNDQQKEHQIILNQHPEVKIQILDTSTTVNSNEFTTQNQNMSTSGLC